MRKYQSHLTATLEQIRTERTFSYLTRFLGFVFFQSCWSRDPPNLRALGQIRHVRRGYWRRQRHRATLALWRATGGCLDGWLTGVLRHFQHK